MGTIVVMSSHVARGAVGLRVIVPALERMGHDAIACPTVVLSNHPRHPRCGGSPVAPETLSNMIDALDSNGWLAKVDAVLTGYFPSIAHVAVAEDLIARVRKQRRDALVVCDPVLGDDPGGLFLPAGVAEAVRDLLVPHAQVLKPNRFELSFLTDCKVETPADAVRAARALSCDVVVASSIPQPGQGLANVVIDSTRAALCAVPYEPDVPRGTGDLLAALVTGGLVAGKTAFESAAAAVAGVQCAVAASRGRDELNVADARMWRDAPLLPLKDIQI